MRTLFPFNDTLAPLPRRAAYLRLAIVTSKHGEAAPSAKLTLKADSTLSIYCPSILCSAGRYLSAAVSCTFLDLSGPYGHSQARCPF